MCNIGDFLHTEQEHLGSDSSKILSQSGRDIYYAKYYGKGRGGGGGMASWGKKNKKLRVREKNEKGERNKGGK